MRILKTVLLASAAMVVASAAQAESTGWYLGAGIGANWATDEDVDYNVGGATGSGEISYDMGYMGVIEGGYDYGLLRTGLELGWRHNDIDNVTVTGADGSVALDGGEADTYSLMLNGYVDIPTGSKFTPYLGLGAGYALVDIGETEGDFAYQGIAGVSYELSQNVSIKADYRYFRTLDLKYNEGNASAEAPYAAHSALIGFTYKFGAPEAKPVPAAAPAPAPVAAKPAPAPMPKSYIVFFDFDKSTVTPEGSSVVTKAATAYKAGAPARIEVTGHADRSGTDKYNQALSQKRADAIKAALIAQGVQASQINVVAKGESAPLVATPDGVREPQNRRVEIVLP